MKRRTMQNADRSGRQKRRRGTARLFVIGALTCGTLLTSRAQAQAPTTTPIARQDAAPAMAFDIPAGEIGAVVREFEALTGLRVTFAVSGIESLPSPGVHGRLTPQEALDALLTGTGVGHARDAAGVFTLDLRTSEFVMVSGDAPTL